MRIRPVSEWVVKSTLEFKWGLQGARIEYTSQGRELLMDIRVLDKIQNKAYTIKQVEGELAVYDEFGIEVSVLTGKPTIKIEEELIQGGFIEAKELPGVVDEIYKGVGVYGDYETKKIEEIEEFKEFENRQGKWLGYRIGAEIYVIMEKVEVPINYKGKLELRYTGEDII